MRTREEEKAYFFGMSKYFQIYNCFHNLKAKMEIYYLNGSATIWWNVLKSIQHLSDRKVRWKQFFKYFKQKYLLEWYYA